MAEAKGAAEPQHMTDNGGNETMKSPRYVRSDASIVTETMKAHDIVARGATVRCIVGLIAIALLGCGPHTLYLHGDSYAFFMQGFLTPLSGCPSVNYSQGGRTIGNMHAIFPAFAAELQADPDPGPVVVLVVGVTDYRNGMQPDHLADRIEQWVYRVLTVRPDVKVIQLDYPDELDMELVHEQLQARALAFERWHFLRFADLEGGYTFVDLIHLNAQWSVMRGARTFRALPWALCEAT